jgi:hypothetical protein
MTTEQKRKLNVPSADFVRKNRKIYKDERPALVRADQDIIFNSIEANFKTALTCNSDDCKDTCTCEYIQIKGRGINFNVHFTHEDDAQTAELLRDMLPESYEVALFSQSKVTGEYTCKLKLK